MDLHDFTNRLKALRSIDRAELIAAGLGHMTDDREWVFFRERPLEWIIKAEDHNAAAVWALVESRCKPKNPLVDPSPLDGHLEPQAKKRGDDALILSAAISLKRIADVADLFLRTLPNPGSGLNGGVNGGCGGPYARKGGGGPS